MQPVVGDEASAEEETNSAIAPPTFRPGGYLSVLLSSQQLLWDVNAAGYVTKEKDFAWSPGLVLRYAFYFRWQRWVGLTIGTDMQFHGDWTNLRPGNLPDACGESGFQPGPSLSFPSLLFGVTQDVLTSWRVTALGQYTASWYPWMTTCAEDPVNEAPADQTVTISPKRPLSAVTYSWGASLIGDYFLKPTVAITAGVGYRLRWVGCVGTPAECAEAKTRDTPLERMEFLVQGLDFLVGMTWQPERRL